MVKVSEVVPEETKEITTVKKGDDCVEQQAKHSGSRDVRDDSSLKVGIKQSATEESGTAVCAESSKRNKSGASKSKSKKARGGSVSSGDLLLGSDSTLATDVVPQASTIPTVVPTSCAPVVTTASDPIQASGSSAVTPTAHNAMAGKDEPVSNPDVSAQSGEKPAGDSDKSQQLSTVSESEQKSLECRERDFKFIMAATGILLSLTVITVFTFVALYLAANFATMGFGTWLIPSALLATFTVSAASSVGYLVYRATDPNIEQENTYTFPRISCASKSAGSSTSVETGNTAVKKVCCASKGSKKQDKNSCSSEEKPVNGTAANTSVKAVAGTAAHPSHNGAAAVSKGPESVASTSSVQATIPSGTLSEAIVTSEASNLEQQVLAS